MKTLIVYTHLIAACVAVGIIFIQDLALSKTRGNSLPPHAIHDLKQAAKIISSSLTVLWISGLLLVLMGYIDNPEEYLKNEKLWAKFSIVIILTLNGVALHQFSFPRVISSPGISGLGIIEKNLVMFTGTVSTISWLFSCYLGIARPWNYTVEYSFVMSLYLFILGVSCIAGCVIAHLFRQQKISAAQQTPVALQRKSSVQQKSSHPLMQSSIPLAERISKM